MGSGDPGERETVRPIALRPPRGPLTDGVVALRLRRVSDFAAISSAGRDPLAMRWLADPPIENDSPEAGVHRAREQWTGGRGAPFVICDAGSGEPLGLINLRFVGGEALLAYSVFASVRGRGIAARAVRLIAGWAFEDLGLPRLVIEADERNTASLRVADRCGFRRVGSRSDTDNAGRLAVMAVFELQRAVDGSTGS